MTVKELLAGLQGCDPEKEVIVMTPHYDPVYYDSADTTPNQVFLVTDTEDDNGIFGVVETDASNNIIKDTLRLESR